MFLAAAPDDMGRLLNLLVSEKAILPRTSDLPSGMSEAEFKRRFGAVDSDPYLAMVDKIDTRLDSLALYTPQ